MTKRKPNGSASILADAMRRVVSESVEDAVKPLKKDVDTLKKDVCGIKGKMGDMETAMHAGFDDIRVRLDPDPQMARPSRN